MGTTQFMPLYNSCEITGQLKQLSVWNMMQLWGKIYVLKR